MDAGRPNNLISVKRNLLRHPLVIGGGSASLVALLALNAAAFMQGLQAPWLLGGVIIADMFVIGIGVLVAAREVLTAEQGTEVVRHALEESEKRLGAIVEWSDDAIIGISLDGVIRTWNRGAEKIFGYGPDEAVGQPIALIIPPEQRAQEEHVLGKLRRGEALEHFETLRRAKSGRIINVSLTISPIRDAAGAVIGASKIARDISQRKQTEAEAERMRSALTAAQARLAAIVDSAMDAVITVDEEQKVVLFNRAAEQVFAVPREHALGSPLERFVPARFREAHRRHVEEFGQTGVSSRRMGDITTLWALRSDGSEFPIEASISQAAEGGKRYFTVILRDITLRKQYEDDLKRQQQELRELSARVLEAREEEKTRIARELHDELGQLLTALKMDLSWLRERLPAGELAQKADEMAGMLDHTVSSTRRISADQRPLMLDDLGLAEAASWLVEDFARRSGIRVEARIAEDLPVEALSRSASTAAYRAVQESLTNIARHSGAKNAWVLMEVDDGALYVEIEDDGRGIAPQDLAKARSLGLKGMRERVAYLGGAVEIGRAPRGGTRLRLRMPLRGGLPTTDGDENREATRA
jgi:PAS domain S-box-containing protein